MSKVCSINGFEIDLIFSNDEQNIIAVEARSELFFDSLECSIGEHKVLLEKIEESDLGPKVLVELEIENKKYTAEALLVDSDKSYVKVNRDLIYSVVNNENVTYIENPDLVEEEKPTAGNLHEALDLVQKYSVEQQSQHEEALKNYTEEYQDRISALETKKNQVLSHIEEEFDKNLKYIQDDVSDKLQVFLEATDKENKDHFSKESEKLNKKLTENYTSFKKELSDLKNFTKKDVLEIINNRTNDTESSVKSFFEKITNKLDKELLYQSSKVDSETKKASKLYSENLIKLKELKKEIEVKEATDSTIAKENKLLKESLSDVNKRFNKLNKKLSLINDKKNKEYNELLAAVNKKDVVEYKTILKEKIQDAELTQVKEELLTEVSENFQQDIRSLKRYVEMSSGGGSNAVQYAEGGRMDGPLGINVSPERDLDIDGHFRINVSPKHRESNKYVAQIKSTNGTAASLQVQGPIRTTHDDFKDSGVTGGFADNSNHFHTVTEINRIKNRVVGVDVGPTVKNIEKVQEQYYAIQNNILQDNKAAFWNWGRVSRELSTTDVSLSNLAGWDVSAIEDSSNRSADSQVPFTTSETTVFTFKAGAVNQFVTGDILQINIQIDFEGAIVAASLYGKVTATTAGSENIQTANVVLYGGNYKTTSEVPDGATQTAVTNNFTIKKLDTSVPSSKLDIDNDLFAVSKSSTGRINTDVISVQCNSNHNLNLNDQITIITDGSSGFQPAQVAYVAHIISNKIFYAVYGRVFEPDSGRTLSTLANASLVGVFKGGIDPLHDFTAGDQLMTFWSGNSGDYTAFQIGPGTEAANDNIAIGRNIYCKEPSTLSLGYGATLSSTENTYKRPPQLIMNTSGLSGYRALTIDQSDFTSTTSYVPAIIQPNMYSVAYSSFKLVRQPTEFLFVNEPDYKNRIHGQYGTQGSTQMFTCTGSLGYNSGDTSITTLRKTRRYSGDNGVDFRFTNIHTKRIGLLNIAAQPNSTSGLVLGTVGGAGNAAFIGNSLAGANTTGNKFWEKSIWIRDGGGGSGNYTTGTGIRFPGKNGQTPTSDQDVLNRYAQGTFTPTLKFGNTSIANYNIRRGYFTRIGNIVQISIQIRIVNPSTSDKAANGQIVVTGLPFVAQGRQVLTVHPQRGWLNMGASTSSAFIGDSSTQITLLKTLNKVDAAGQGTNQGYLYTQDFLASDGVTNIRPLNFAYGTSTTDGQIRAFYFDIEGSYTTDAAT
jgi:hypothetical protein